MGLALTITFSGSAPTPATVAAWLEASSGSERFDDVRVAQAGQQAAESLVLRVPANSLPSPFLLDRLVAVLDPAALSVATPRVIPVQPDGVTCVLGTSASIAAFDEGRIPVIDVPDASVFIDVRVDDPAHPDWVTSAATRPARGAVRSAPHPGTLPSTTLGAVLHRVGALVPGAREHDTDCFLSVVMRTQGRRMHCLEQALLSLAGQTDRDFEVVIVRHHVPAEHARQIDDMVAVQPRWLRDRTRVLSLDEGNRAAPLNLGFSEARGACIAVLDDDDVVLPHWVETFRDLYDDAPGRVLRAAALTQVVTGVEGTDVPQALSPLEAQWPRAFDLHDHLLTNRTPIMSAAFPRGAFHDLGLRFDEELLTTEDWDFLVSAASLLGVATSPEFTSIYRWWRDSHSSRHHHDESIWAQNHQRVQERMDDAILLMPPGTARRLRELDASRSSELVQQRHEIDLRDAEIAHLRTEYENLTALRREALDALQVERARRADEQARAEKFRARHQRSKRRVTRLQRKLEQAQTQIALPPARPSAPRAQWAAALRSRARSWSPFG